MKFKRLILEDPDGREFYVDDPQFRCEHDERGVFLQGGVLLDKSGKPVGYMEIPARRGPMGQRVPIDDGLLNSEIKTFYVGLDGSGPHGGLSGATGPYLPFGSLGDALKKSEELRKAAKDKLDKS